MSKKIGIIIFLSLTLFCCHTEKTGTHNNDLASLYQKATGVPQTMVLSCYKTTLIANNTDETLLRVSVVDSTGFEILEANFPFQISSDGDVNIMETDHDLLEKIENDSLKIWKSVLVNGKKELILRAGNTVDKIKVEVTADSLWAGSHEIHTIPKDLNFMKPTVSQLIPSGPIVPKMIGADISFLPQLENRGMKFYDEQKEMDAIHILKNHGFNCIRLRIFVNPENPAGYSPGTGYCGLDSTLVMAKRIKEAGLNFLLDFHYSDYWADPQKQTKPKAWEGIQFEDLTDTLKTYTKTTLLKFKNQGTLPYMVQIGNEINHGIVWPDGHISHLDNLAALLKAGASAVEEVDSTIVIMMQLALGGQKDEAIFWFDNMIARGLEFDIIGLSYYPRWHGTLDDLQISLEEMIKRYKKDVNVVEYSAFKRAIHEIVFNLPNNRGNGTCIWEPLNTWSQIFDKNGNPTSEMLIYDEMSAKYLK